MEARVSADWLVAVLCRRTRWCGCAEPVDRRALEPRRPDLRRRRARRDDTAPPARRAVEGARRRRRQRRHERLRPAARTAASRAWSTGLSSGANVLTADAAGRTDASSRSPTTRTAARFLRPAGPAVGVPGDARDASATSRRPTRTSTSPSVTGQFAAYDPESPPSDVADDDDRPGQDGARSSSAIETGYQDRDQYQIAVLYDPASRGRPWAPQPQCNHKLLITHGASCGIDHQSGTRARRRWQRRRRSARGFAVMSTALDNAGHNCNIVTQAESLVMAKERLVEQLRRAALHDRHRLLGRLAHPAAGRQRLPRHLPGDPAAVQLPGRVVDRPAARRLPPDPRLLREPGEVGHRRRLGPGRRSPRSRATPTTSTRSSSTRVYWTVARRSGRRLRGRAGRATTTTRRRTPAACAARSPTT